MASFARQITRPITFPGPTIRPGAGYDVMKPFTPPFKWRGLGQSMRATPQGKNGGTNISTTARTRHYSKVSFRRCRIVIPVFETIGSPLADTLHSGASAILNFQAGLEYPFAAAASGLATRAPFLWSGANYVTFNASTHNANFGYLISDVLDLGVDIPKDTAFGLWVTVELPAGVYNNALPYMINATNNLDRWIGQSFSASSRIAGLGGASDYALTSTSITKLGTTQTGVTGIFTPAMLLVNVPGNARWVCNHGDSLGYGNNEGQAGSSTFGDSMGSLLGNAGMLDRGVFEVAGLNYFNIAKGSDGYKFWKTAANWKYRSQLMVLGNPTHILLQGGVNDLTQSLTVNGWAGNTVYSALSVVSANGNIYLCDVGGTSAASGGPTGTGTNIVDNTVRWSFIMALPGTAVPRGAALIYADMLAVHDQIRALLPSAKLLKTFITPNTTSSDSWVTDTNQTVATGWGDSTSRRALLHALFISQAARLGLTATIDPNAYLEFTYPTQTSKWVVNGVANYATQDGTHHNSKGANLAQAAFLPSFFT